MTRTLFSVAMCCALFVGGCNGDGGDPLTLAPTTQEPPVTEPTPPPVVPKDPQPKPPDVEPPTEEPMMPVGIWHGSTKREGRTVLGVVVPDGQTWLLYSVVGAPDWAGGAVIGKMSTEGSSWTMKGALYVNQELKTRATINASGTWLEKQRLLGNFQVQFDVDPGLPLYEMDGIDLIYDTRSNTPFDMTKAAGTYLGLWIPLEEVLLTLKADGTITGRTAYGCTFGGSATVAGAVAEGQITFDGPPCINGYATIRGILGYDDNAKKLAAVGSSTDRNQLLIYIGKKQ